MKYFYRSSTLGLIVLGSWFGSVLQGADAVPALQGRVNDYANMLSVTEKSNLEQMLTAAEAGGSNQIAILITPTLGGDSVENYAQRVFDSWRLGQAKLNNGVLIVWAPTEREVRIHIGYGLEGTLTDGLSSQIIRNELGPRLAQNQYYEGLRVTVERILQAIKGEYKIEQTAPQKKGMFTPKQLGGLLVCGVVLLIVGSINWLAGGITGVALGFGLGVLLWGTAAAAIALAVLGFLVGAGATIIIEVASQTSTGGGRSGRRGSSSSSSSGGFGGGGGRSGGGGASGKY